MFPTERSRLLLDEVVVHGKPLDLRERRVPSRGRAPGHRLFPAPRVWYACLVQCHGGGGAPPPARLPPVSAPAFSARPQPPFFRGGAPGGARGAGRSK